MKDNQKDIKKIYNKIINSPAHNESNKNEAKIKPTNIKLNKEFLEKKLEPLKNFGTKFYAGAKKATTNLSEAIKTLAKKGNGLLKETGKTLKVALIVSLMALSALPSANAGNFSSRADNYFISIIFDDDKGDFDKTSIKVYEEDFESCSRGVSYMLAAIEIPNELFAYLGLLKYGHKEIDTQEQIAYTSNLMLEELGGYKPSLIKRVEELVSSSINEKAEELMAKAAEDGTQFDINNYNAMLVYEKLEEYNIVPSPILKAADAYMERYREDLFGGYFRSQDIHCLPEKDELSY